MYIVLLLICPLIPFDNKANTSILTSKYSIQIHERCGRNKPLLNILTLWWW